MSLTLGEVKKNAEYNLRENRNFPIAVMIGNIQMENYNKLIAAGETDDFDFDEAVTGHPEIKIG